MSVITIPADPAAPTVVTCAKSHDGRTSCEANVLAYGESTAFEIQEILDHAGWLSYVQDGVLVYAACPRTRHGH